MCAESFNSTMDAVADRLAAAGSILTVTHAHPDGDAMGSMAALARSAQGAGKRACMLVADDLSPRYDFLTEDLRTAKVAEFAAAAGAADIIAIVDTCTWSQLEGLAGPIAAMREKVLVIDHHSTRDDVGSDQWIDASAAAAGVMVGELLQRLGWPIDRRVAEALCIALTTDTGWLRFSSTDGRCLRLMADWLEKGVAIDELYRRIFQTDRIERLRLMAWVLAGLELHCGGRLAVMGVRQEDFRRTGARPDETENLINEALRVATVTAAIMLVEQADGTIRTSLRSRGAVDVARLAQAFGGGGHARAAGCRSDMPFDEFRRKLIEAFVAAMPLA